MGVDAADERRHPPGRSAGWEESWYFDFVDAGAGLGGYARLALHPGADVAWYWAGVAGPRRRLVAVRDHDVAPPGPRGLEVRSSGLWTDLVCETPLDHWTVGLEAFGVAYDDPLDAWGDERGDQVGLGFDLEWEATGGCAPAAGGGGYAQACEVHGDVLVGAERFSVAGFGTRTHAWGPRDWTAAGAGWAGGRLEDATAFAGPAAVAGGSLAPGTELDVGGLGLVAEPLALAPVLVPEAGARLARALCRFSTVDGRTGHGWAEVLNPT